MPFILGLYLSASYLFNFDPVAFLRPGYKPYQVNENPHFSLMRPLENSCVIIKDTSDSWIKNDKMECNK